MSNVTNMEREVWYTFKIREGGRLLTPQTNPHEYEHPFDYVFATPEEARAFLAEEVEVENITPEEANTFILCRELLEVI